VLREPPRPVASVSAVREALRDVWPVLLGIAPFAVYIGVTIERVHTGTALGLGSAVLFFSGTAHLTAITMLAHGTNAVAVVGAVALINARLSLYGAALHEHFRDQPTWFRWLAPHLVIDQTYALVTGRPAGDAHRFRRYWLVVGACVAVVWLGGYVAGIAFGPLLSAQALDVTSPAIFVALLVPLLVSGPARIVAGGAAVATVAALLVAPAAALPSGIGVGLVAGVLIDRSAA
jgi:predicted branched-subunit amino acid permease